MAPTPTPPPETQQRQPFPRGPLGSGLSPGQQKPGHPASPVTCLSPSTPPPWSVSSVPVGDRVRFSQRKFTHPGSARILSAAACLPRSTTLSSPHTETRGPMQPTPTPPTETPPGRLGPRQEPPDRLAQAGEGAWWPVGSWEPAASGQDRMSTAGGGDRPQLLPLLLGPSLQAAAQVGYPGEEAVAAPPQA